MHILFNTGGMLLMVLLGSLLLLRLLSRFLSWETRGMLHLVVLSLPLVSSLPLVGGWVHISTLCCAQSSPYWDHVLDIILLLLLSFIVFGALIYGGLRLLFMGWLMRRHAVVVDPCLQAQVDYWAHLRGIAPVTVRLCSQAHPLALVYGIRHPTMLLSNWMLEHLDERELEAVVTHELMHIARHDYLINWLTTMLRDAFFYLPTSQRAYRQFRKEKEIACDDLVVAATQRPLALASALTKVWLHLLDQPRSSLAHSLVEPDQPITSRVNRLLSYSPGSREKVQRSLSGIRLALGVTLPIVLVGLILMSVEIICWPNEWLWHLL